MSGRFGRKKKRKMREEIERLKSANTSLVNQVRYAEFRAQNAGQEALNMFIKHGDIYKDVFKECAYGLGRALGEELNKHTDKLIGTIIQKPLEFTYRKQLGSEVAKEGNIVEVCIPLRELRYRRVVL